jgi:hypothetical protein
MVYRLTGMLAWVFGPASSCPTYSKCWFGVLACGKPQLERIDEKQMIGFLDTFYHNYTRLPARRNGWTIRSLYMHMRVIGAEIIVPEQRVATVAGGDDVIIAQYVTTKTYSPSVRDLYRLEIRQEEYYPAVLYGFTDFETEKLGTFSFPWRVVIFIFSLCRCLGGRKYLCWKQRRAVQTLEQVYIHQQYFT